MFTVSGYQPKLSPFNHIASLIVDLIFCFKKALMYSCFRINLLTQPSNNVSDVNSERDLILLVVLFVFCNLGLCK